MFKQGSGVVGGDASTEETPCPSRVSSEGGGVLLVVMGRQQRKPPPSCISSEGGGVSLVVICQQRKHPLHLVF